MPSDARWQPVQVGDACAEMRASRHAPYKGRRLWPSVGEYPIYGDYFYHVMLEDEERNGLFRDAISQHAADRVVLELGTGPDLLWSSVAAESGAAQVYAVEVLEDSAREARERARKIGPHVRVLQGDATAVSLPERAGMCIAELVGAIGGAEGIAAAIEDARRRHLQPGALVIPHRVRTPIAALGARELLGGKPFLHPEAVACAEQVLQSAASIFDLRICISGLREDDLLTTSALLEDLDLATGGHEDPEELSLVVTRDGEVDSCVLWLQMQCAPGQPYLDSMATSTNWTPVLVPFAVDRPIRVRANEVLTLRVTKRLYDNVHPEWSFSGSVLHSDGSETPVRAECPYARGPFRASWLHRSLFKERAPA